MDGATADRPIDGPRVSAAVQRWSALVEDWMVRRVRFFKALRSQTGYARCVSGGHGGAVVFAMLAGVFG